MGYGDGRTIAELASFLRRGLVNRGDVDELFAQLMRTFDASGVMFADGFAEGGFLTQGVPDRWMHDHARLAHEDPAFPTLSSAPAGTWWCAQRDMTGAEWTREVSHRFLDAGFHDLALVRLYNPFRDDLVLGIYRDDRPFSTDDLQMLELLYPHIAGASATRRALALIDGRAHETAACVYVAFPTAKVELDSSSRAVIERRVGRVDAIGWRRIERALLAVASRFAFAQAGGRSQQLWRGLHVDFATVPPRAGEQMRLVGFFVEEDDEDDAGVPALVESLLSPRQLAVATHFAAGMDVPTIAETLRIGRETVRSHLRGAYQKLDVASRAQLARVLSSSA